jgi:hypothetical protein
VGAFKDLLADTGTGQVTPVQGTDGSMHVHMAGNLIQRPISRKALVWNGTEIQNITYYDNSGVAFARVDYTYTLGQITNIVKVALP